MKLSTKISVLTGLLFFGTSMVMAADISTINITGNVIATPCTVDAANSVMNIEFDNIQATALATAGSFSPWKSFAITLSNCPVSTTKVSAAFSGTADTSDATRYKNTGTASNMSVELQSSGGVNLGNSKKTNVTVNSSNKQAVFSLQTRAYSAAGNVMPGTINSTVLATFTYQ
ncbi:fimbrial protein [Yersinia sp. 2545 StPb PI]|uniref:fimbrial protein n=1 Tax=unclassified Yersinia (in: enterobacteria) TaxID=2653513 RepID=UPI003FA413DA